MQFNHIKFLKNQKEKEVYLGSKHGQSITANRTSQGDFHLYPYGQVIVYIQICAIICHYFHSHSLRNNRIVQFL